MAIEGKAAAVLEAKAMTVGFSAMAGAEGKVKVT